MKEAASWSRRALSGEKRRAQAHRRESIEGETAASIFYRKKYHNERKKTSAIETAVASEMLKN